MAKSNWGYVFIYACVTVATVLGLFSRMPSHADFSRPAPWSFLLFVCAFLAFGVVFVGLALHGSKDLLDKFDTLSQVAEFFGEEQSLRLFRVGSLCLIFFGVGNAIQGWLHPPMNWSWEIPVAGGIGVLIGVLLRRIIRRKS